MHSTYNANGTERRCQASIHSLFSRRRRHTHVVLCWCCRCRLCTFSTDAHVLTTDRWTFGHPFSWRRHVQDLAAGRAQNKHPVILVELDAAHVQPRVRRDLVFTTKVRTNSNIQPKLLPSSGTTRVNQHYRYNRNYSVSKMPPVLNPLLIFV